MSSTLQIITRLIVGGAQETVMLTADLLNQRADWRVDVVSGPQTGSEGSLIEAVRARGVPLTIEPSLVREVNPAKDVLALVRLFQFIRRGQYTIVHTNSSKAGVLGRIAAKLAGVPVIVHTVHGWSFHEHMSPLRRSLFTALEKLAASLSDAMIVVAEPDIEKGLREGIGRPEQYHVIRSAISMDTFDPATVDAAAVRRELGVPQEAPVLGNVGRFSPQKNPLDWVRVAARLAHALPACRFLLVGDGPLRADVEALIADNGLTDRFVLTGLRRDVPRMLAAMDVFLLTSLWEGLPRVIPQAMSMRVPVVANRADGTVEAITHGVTGFLAEPGDLDALTEHCLTLLRDSERRRAMGARGHTFAAREFDVHEMVARIDRLYRDLLIEKQMVH
jgi:glycosyltransferase involved in cell wall biosynthesis